MGAPESPDLDSASSTDADSVDVVEMAHCRTTLKLTGFAKQSTRRELLSMLDGEGLAGEYDFVYLPVDFKTVAGCHGEAALQAKRQLETSQSLDIAWSEHQGQ